MSPEYRARVSLAVWKKKLEENSQETLEVGNTLTHVHGPASVQAVLRDGDGRELRLEREGESWRIVSDVVEFYDQSTPRAALQAFVHAMQRRRYDVVLRLMPDADKEAVTTESMEKPGATSHATTSSVCCRSCANTSRTRSRSRAIARRCRTLIAHACSSSAKTAAGKSKTRVSTT